jgi:uncharacterized protein (DUF433 family)
MTALTHQRSKLNLPAYSLSEAACYLQLPVSSLRSWIYGASYPTRKGPKRSKGLIDLPEPSKRLLSFVNLVEAHVLSAIRKRHEVSLQKVRRAIDNLQGICHSSHALASEEFKTDGLNLFVERYGSYISVSEDNQLQMKEILEAYLQRVDYSPQGLPVRLFPYTRAHGGAGQAEEEPRSIVIDPSVAFGKPALSGTGIKTEVVVDRFLAGDEPKAIAEDYGRSLQEIDEAIRWELRCRPRAA